jgi:hypothetical protein
MLVRGEALVALEYPRDRLEVIGVGDGGGISPLAVLGTHRRGVDVSRDLPSPSS